MDHLPMDRAFAHFGAESIGRQRPLSATAGDGSLVLVCQSGGFSRPGIGVLRYTAQLSALKAGASRLAKFRARLGEAMTAGTDVRLIIETLAAGRQAARVHVRGDLVGKVTGFDGDSYVVDFSRPAPPPPEPKLRRR